MIIGTSRDSLAEVIKSTIFEKHLWSLIASPRVMIKLVTSNSINSRNIYCLLERNVSRKLFDYGAKLESISFRDEGKLVEVDLKSVDKFIYKILTEDIDVIFKVMIKHKLYEFEVSDKKR